VCVPCIRTCLVHVPDAAFHLVVPVKVIFALVVVLRRVHWVVVVNGAVVVNGLGVVVGVHLVRLAVVDWVAGFGFRGGRRDWAGAGEGRDEDGEDGGDEHFFLN